MPGNTESSEEHVPDHADDTVPTRQGDELVRTDRGSISPEIRRLLRDDQVFEFWSCLKIPRKVGSYVGLGIGNVLVYPYIDEEEGAKGECCPTPLGSFFMTGIRSTMSFPKSPSSRHTPVITRRCAIGKPCKGHYVLQPELFYAWRLKYASLQLFRSSSSTVRVFLL